MVKIRTYWITSQASSLHLRRGALLEKKGYEIRFIENLRLFNIELTKARPAIVIIGDEGTEEDVEAIIVDLSSRPEIKGTRTILSVSRLSEKLSGLAAGTNFRDIIPLAINDAQWINRFIYATARRALDLPQPVPQVTINSITSLSIPARVVWIAPDRLLFEARIRPPVGATMTLAGGFPKVLGVKALSLTVEETRQTDLMYRFSDAVLATWHVPETTKANARQILDHMRTKGFGPRYRAFLAVQTPELRDRLVRELKVLDVEMNVALQKQAIVDEPRFFGPHIVFIEDKLCMNEDIVRFKRMLDHLGPNVPVFVIGAKADLPTLKRFDPKRKITSLTILPMRITREVFMDYLPSQIRKETRADVDAIHVAPDHNFSHAEVHLSARLSRIHTTAAQLSVPVPVGMYGLCRVNSPFLKKAIGYAPYAKITGSYKNLQDMQGNFTHIAECYLCDIPQREQQRLGLAITNFVSEHLTGKQHVPAEKAESAPAAATDDSTQLQASRPEAKKSADGGKPALAATIAGAETFALRSVAPAAAVNDEEPRINFDEIGSTPNPGPDAGEGRLGGLFNMDPGVVGGALTRGGRSVADNIVKGFTRKRVKTFVTLIAALSFVFAVLWAIFYVAGPGFEKSGSGYSNQFKRFEKKKKDGWED